MIDIRQEIEIEADITRADSEAESIFISARMKKNMSERKENKRQMKCESQYMGQHFPLQFSPRKRWMYGSAFRTLIGCSL